ncbi:hypothetical protein ABB37_04462 [Leptomonas pyrrhocoris]|uniref:Uncharacterized protein n=1 Tax=Leptomonas pyrrhocoris TaxID=157538 RepID=A0A0M9G2Z5_LEPPY|nr:hypothetical protein ABB37_04462 [Leptomonas pyrrhocoris]KPA81109.1 hypothetical protein ABB37_04462 [Leptomonas pyrrhocoris]|eukprot:XP_015659548.1 hypothetical protein ABB37_04462 [Leptomonas pyrrhocoris]
MSFGYRGLQRSDRLLPLESSEVLAATDCFRLHVLDDECDVRLHEHVSFYWDQQRDYQAYQRRLLRQVRSTKGPVRFVGFPQVRTPQTAGEHDRSSASAAAPNVHAHGHDAGTTSATQGRDTVLVASAPQSAPPSHASDSADDAVAESMWTPPRSLAAWNWVRLVAPYERLLCPSLLFSALLSPAVGGSNTSLLYGTQPPSSSSSSSPVSSLRSQPCVTAKWSTQTCRTLWALHDTAAAASLPAQEVYVLCAGTLLYLDVVITSGKVWDELEGLWGKDWMALQDDSSPATADKSSTSHSTKDEDSAFDSQVNSLTAFKANLSQPPQTYASLVQHVRILLEALLFVAPAIEGGAHATSATLSAIQKASLSSPQPLLPWLLAAAEAEEWTAFTNPNTATNPSSPSVSSYTDHNARHTSAVAQVLKLAVREWLSRRGTTVSAAAPTGSRAVSLPMRDLCVSRGSPQLSRYPTTNAPAATRPRQANSKSADTTGSTGELENNENSGIRSSGGDSGGAGRELSLSSPTADVGSGVGAAASSPSSTSVQPFAFEAFEPHDTPRAQHPFSLPPLPQDPAFLVFLVVWRRTLRRCVLERNVARQQLRQVILGQAGQRCEELLKMARQKHRTTPLTPLSTQGEAAVVRSNAGIQGVKGKDGKPSSDTSIKAAPLHTSSDSSISPSPPSLLAAAATKPPSSPSAPTVVQPTPLAPPAQPLRLLTNNPAATSFRVRGPRSGEWLTSRTRAWSGFRGELFRCVGSPPPPPTPSPALTTPLGEPHGSPSTRPRLRSSRVAQPRAEIYSTSSELLLEPFVDGALELDSSTRSSPSASATNAATADPLTTEELADRLCRLGAALPCYATEISGDRLRPADADFARDVLQQQCLPLFLACKRRGIQQWCLRGWLRGLVLTLLDNSGTESRVATPAKLLQMSKQQLAAAMGGADTTDTTAALRMLLEGGLSEVVAFLEYVQKRKERTLRWLSVRRESAGGTATAFSSSFPTSLSTCSAVEALLLRRAEESAIFSIFQCHPEAVALSGCGVQRLALYANAHKGRSLALLVRTCGVVVEWDMQDCYAPPRHRRLRVPKRMTTQERRKSASGVVNGDEAPPAEIGTAVERLTLRHVRGMLQYYCRALVSSSPSAAQKGVGATTSNTTTRSPGRAAPASSPTPAPAASMPDTSSSSPTPSTGTKRPRDDNEGSEDPLPKTTADATAAARSNALPTAKEEDSPHTKPEEERDTTKTDDSGGGAAPDQSPSQPSTVAEMALERTTLFPVDRAVVLFVLRHHPQYYTHVVGCGVKEVYVALGSTSADAAVAATTETEANSTGAAPAEDNEAASKAFSPQADPDDRASMLATAAHPSTASTSPPRPTSGAVSKPVLVVERVCGQHVGVDIEACYIQRDGGCTLRPRVMLV